MAIQPATNRQVPENAIMDLFGKQPYLGNQFMASSGSVTVTGTSEVPVMYLACPSAAVQGVGTFQNAKSLFCNLRAMYCADLTGATNILFRVYLSAATISGGSSVTPVNMRPANPNVSVAVVLKSPTIGSNGTFLYSYPAPLTSRELIIVDPGKNALITAQPTATSTAVVNLSWYEI